MTQTLSTGCIGDCREPMNRKARLEGIRLDLQDRILQALDEIQTVNEEIDQCDVLINEAREAEA